MSNKNFSMFSSGFCITFDNGFGVSITIGPMSYSDNGKVTAEIAVINPDGSFHRMPGHNDDVIGHQTPNMILSIMNTVASFTDCGESNICDSCERESNELFDSPMGMYNMAVLYCKNCYDQYIKDGEDE